MTANAQAAPVAPASGVTPERLYRTLAFAEAVSWTLLIGGMVLRAVTGSGVGVSIGGAVHGFVFLAYAAVALLVALNQRWSIGVAFVAVAVAVVPYATIPTEIWLRRSGRLEGAWRTAPGDDPRDRRAIDGFLRWWFRHPLVLLAVLAAAIVLAYVVLMLVGPPGGRG